MKISLDHIAITTDDIEVLKNFYVRFFNGKANEKYTNTSTGFESYFISFGNGARLEIIKKNINAGESGPSENSPEMHIAFGVENMNNVILKAEEMKNAGFPVLRGPRITGDGYFEFETLDPDKNHLEVTTRKI
jgi:lactoylglutathione lyase